MCKITDIQGFRFGRLTVLAIAGKSKDRHITWTCKCDCGNIKVISGNSMRSGMTTSCGCYLSEVIKLSSNKSSTHKMTKSATYASWRSMLSRCNNKNAPDYDRYGGRGITVCERWNSFENFLADMSERPSGKTLDRKDNEGNYEPSNCRWATRIEQGCNTRGNVNLTFNGQTNCLAEWARVTGIKEKAIRDRFNDGWTAERILTTPVRVKAKRA